MPGVLCKLTPQEAMKYLKSPIMCEFMGAEKEFEENVVDNIDQICYCLALPEIVAVARQKRFDVGGFAIIPDIIVQHKDGSLTVFEVKKANEKYPCTAPVNQMKAVGQILLYGNVLPEIFHREVRLALIDNKIYYRTVAAFMGNNLPITLVELQRDLLFVPYYAWGGLPYGKTNGEP